MSYRHSLRMAKKYPFSLCCLSLELESRGIKMKTMTAKKFSSMERLDAIRELSFRTLNNCQTTFAISKYCVDELNISGYRMSSGMFPLINYSPLDISLDEYPDKEEIVSILKQIGKYSIDNGLRLSFHPGEYTTVTSENPDTINNSLRDLEHHSWIYDVMELPVSHYNPINFHIRKDGDPKGLFDIASKNISRLSKSCVNRIVLEVNDNRNGTWTVQTLKEYFYENVGIPITFDSLHCKLLHGEKTLIENALLAKSTWGETRPLFHYSFGVGETKSHADYTDELFPKEFYNLECDWDIELKAKCLAIKKIISEIKLGY